MHKVEGTLMLLFSFTFIMYSFFKKMNKENHQRLLDITKSLSVLYIIIWFLIASYMVEIKYINIPFETIYLYLSFSLMGFGVLGIVIYYTNIDLYLLKAYKRVIPYLNIGIFIMILIASISYFIMRDSMIDQHKILILITCGLIAMSNSYLTEE